MADDKGGEGKEDSLSQRDSKFQVRDLIRLPRPRHVVVRHPRRVETVCAAEGEESECHGVFPYTRGVRATTVASRP